MNSYSQMPLSYLTPQFRQWEKYLVSHQGANLFFLKNTGILPRLLQFRDYYQKSQKSKLAILDLKYAGATDPYTLESELKSLTGPVLIVAYDYFARPDSDRLALAIQSHYLSSPGGIIIAHECTPHELYQHHHTTASALCVHPLPFALPTEAQDIASYIYNITKLWSISLKPTHVDQVISYCGNQPWLINECIRLWVEDPDKSISEITSHKNFVFRLTTLFESMPKQFLQFMSGQTQSPEILSELHSFGILDSTGEPIGSWLSTSLAQYHQTLLTTTTEQTIFNSLDISLQFSPGERRLIHLFNHASYPVSREIAGEAFYGADASYSDWALSQIISRLRHKLAKFNLPLKITAKRGAGYVVSRN